MTHPFTTLPAATALRRNIPPLSPRELVTDKMLREYAALDPLHIADGSDKVMLAGLSMILPDICGELLARRLAMAKGLA
jgi:hypothetical protein